MARDKMVILVFAGCCIQLFVQRHVHERAVRIPPARLEFEGFGSPSERQRIWIVNRLAVIDRLAIIWGKVSIIIFSSRTCRLTEPPYGM